jgi:hypothetical protein
VPERNEICEHGHVIDSKKKLKGAPDENNIEGVHLLIDVIGSVSTDNR